MEESINYEQIEAEIRKIRYNLENTELEDAKRILILNILRYDVSLIEDRDKIEKVRYNYEKKRLEYSESIQIGIAISLNINEIIRNESNIEVQQKLYECMKETYYYLARYLFEYYLPAMEFGIAPEKQFIAPRTSVLNKIAKENRVEKIVVGVPINMDGTQGFQAQNCIDFSQKLLGFDIIYEDERLTSEEAESRLKSRKVDFRKNKGLVDMESACVILEQYLARKTNP